MDFYFAHPYSSWERGTDENTNNLMRQYLPKSHSLMNVSFQKEIMDHLDLRPENALFSELLLRYSMNINPLHLLVESKQYDWFNRTNF